MCVNRCVECGKELDVPRQWCTYPCPAYVARVAAEHEARERQEMDRLFELEFQKAQEALAQASGQTLPVASDAERKDGTADAAGDAGVA